MRRSWNTTCRRIGSSLVVAVLILCGLAAPAAAADQVPFTASAGGVVTGVTHLPGGLIQVDFDGTGTATHLGDYTGTASRIQDHQGNFTTISVLIGANGKDSVFLSTGGHFERTGGSCVLISTGTFIVTGGTGAFADATGSGTFTAEFDQCADTGFGTWTGTISRPNSG